MGILISVIIPVYNVEKYLNQCIDSVIHQTYKNLEIILVDDGSIDSSGTICDMYAKNDSRIKVIHKENGGLVSARKAGLQIATGDFTTSVDGDDWIDEQMYEKLVKVLEETNADIVTSGVYIENNNSTVKKYDKLQEGVYDTQDIDLILHNFVVDISTGVSGLNTSICNKLIKRSIFSKYYFDLNSQANWGEDFASVTACILNSEKIAITHEVFYHYRQVENSVSHTRRDSIIKEFGMVYEYLHGIFEKHTFSEDLLELLQHIVLNRILGSFNRYVFSPDKISIPTYILINNTFDKNEKIILYGAGVVGKSIFNQLSKCHCNIVGWVDNEADSYFKKGLPVKKVEMLKQLEFDKVLICIKHNSTAQDIKSDLVNIYGIDEDKIILAEIIPFSQYCVL